MENYLKNKNISKCDIMKYISNKTDNKDKIGDSNICDNLINDNFNEYKDYTKIIFQNKRISIPYFRIIQEIYPLNKMH